MMRLGRALECLLWCFFGSFMGWLGGLLRGFVCDLWDIWVDNQSLG